MPIASAKSLLEQLIYASLSLGAGASVNNTGQMFSNAIATICPMGLLPKGPNLVPLVPSGLPTSQNIITSSLSLGAAANISSTATQMAQGVSLMAPDVPTIGLPILITELQAALSKQSSAAVDVVANLIAMAIINYYIAGGVV